MRLLYIFPRTTPDPVERAAEHARRCEILQAATSHGTVIDIRELEHCPPSIESIRDAYAVSPAIIALAEELEYQYDGMIVGCFGDPAVDGATEATHIPIVGCALPSMTLALLLGQQFGVLSPSASSAARVRTMVMAQGLLDRYAGAEPLGIGVREFARDPGWTLAVATEAGRRIVARGAEVILLGCLRLAFTGVGDELQEHLGIPVINPLRAAVRTCETLCNLRLTAASCRRMRLDERHAASAVPTGVAVSGP